VTRREAAWRLLSVMWHAKELWAARRDWYSGISGRPCDLASHQASSKISLVLDLFTTSEAPCLVSVLHALLSKEDSIIIILLDPHPMVAKDIIYLGVFSVSHESRLSGRRSYLTTDLGPHSLFTGWSHPSNIPCVRKELNPLTDAHSSTLAVWGSPQKGTHMTDKDQVTTSLPSQAYAFG
jgi:hypothetical protein